MTAPAVQSPLHEADNPADREPLEEDQRPDPKVSYLLDPVPFGEYDDDGCWWIVQETKGWHSPPGMKTARSDRPHGPGESRGTAWRKPRVITLKGLCLAPSVGARQAALDRFAAVCSDGGQLHELRVIDQLGRVRTADVDLEGEPDVTLRGEQKFGWQIQLGAPDPRKHGIWQDPISEFRRVIDQGGTVGASGLDFDGAGGLDFSGGGLAFGTAGTAGSSTAEAGIAEVANYGTALAYPLFRIKGPVLQPAVVDLSNGRTLLYVDEVKKGETLVINTDEFPSRGYRQHAVWSSERGNVRALLYAQSGWPAIPGRSTAQYQFRAGALGVDGGAELMVSVRSAWS